MKRVRSELHRAFVTVCLIGTALVMSPGAVDAAVTAFDTFGPGDSYYAPGPYGVDGNAAFQAFRFVPTESGDLDAITVAIGRMGTAMTATQFDLYDGTDSALGNLLESFVVSNLAPSGFTGAVVSSASVVTPYLSAGEDYWLSYSEPGVADGTRSLWFRNDADIEGKRITSLLPIDDDVLPAFRIEVSGLPVVPVPGAFLLGSLGVGAVGWMRRRRTL